MGLTAHYSLWHKRATSPTKVSGWFWGSFCKTQYASNPRFGGWENFRHCHVSLLALLDVAAQLGLRTKVTDEGRFASRRNLDELAQEITEWNELIAGFVGGLKDTLGGEFDAPITQFPDFEHLEARGAGRLDRERARRRGPRDRPAGL